MSHTELGDVFYKPKYRLTVTVVGLCVHDLYQGGGTEDGH